MQRCLSPQQLDNYLSGQCSAESRTHLESHLEGCTRCQNQFREWTRVECSDVWRRAAQPQPALSDTGRALLDGLKEPPIRAIENPLDSHIDYNDLYRHLSVRLKSHSERQTVRTGPQSSRLPNVPGFEIVGELGRGGMGVVYRARQIAHDRSVALKMILAGHEASPEDLGRFRDEGEAISRLRHPNIVQIFEVGQFDGRLYFALEFVDGGTLADKIRSRPMPARSSAQLVESLARAMHYAHKRDIIHRDLKPANVLLHSRKAFLDLPSPGGQPDDWDFHRLMPKITDFGLAKLLDRSSDNGHTASGDVVGTPSYMAPEQATGKAGKIGPATDVYSLGAILYELLTGRPPFQGANPMDTLLQVHTKDPTPPRKIVADIPPALEAICLKCLRKDPSRRYSSAEALADELRLYLDGQPIQTQGLRGLWGGDWRYFALWMGPFLVMLLTIAASAAMVVLWLRGEDRSQRNQVLREESRFAKQQQLRHKIEAALADCESGQTLRGLSELTLLLGQCEKDPDLVEIQAALRRNLMAWSAVTPQVRENFNGQTCTPTGKAREFCWIDDGKLRRGPLGSKGETFANVDLDGAKELTVSSNQRTFAAVCSDGLRWVALDEAAPRRTPVFKEPAGMSLSPDGEALLLRDGTNPGTVLLLRWDSTRREVEVHTIDGPTNPTTWIWSRNAEQILIGAADGGIWSKSITAMSPAARIGQVDRPIVSATVDRGSSQLVLATDDGQVHVGHLSESRWTEFMRFRVHVPGKVLVACAENGRLLSSGVDRQIKLWDLQTRVLLAALSPESDVEQIGFLDGGTAFYARIAQGRTCVWDCNSQPASKRYTFEAPLAGRPLVTGDRQTLIAATKGSSGTIQLRKLGEPESPAAVLQPEPGHSFQLVVANPNGRWFMTANREGNRSSIQFWDMNREKWKKAVALDEALATCAVVSADGKFVYVGTSAGKVYRLGVETSAEAEAILTFPGPIRGLSLRRDGTAIAVAGSVANKSEVRAWLLEPAVESFGRPMILEERVDAIEWEADSKTIRTTDSGRRLLRWSAESGERLAANLSDADVVAFNGAADQLAALDADGNLRIHLSAHAQTMPLRCESHASLVSAEFSPDGQYLLCVWSDTVRLVDAATGLVVGPPLKLTNLNGAEFINQGSEIMAWSANEIRIWKSPTPEREKADDWRVELRRRWHADLGPKNSN